MEPIVTLTMNPVVDKSTSVKHVVPEEKLRCERPRFEPGGGGINVSRALARLEGSSVALFPCGGPTGEMLQRLLQDERIDFRVTPIQDNIRENLMVLEQASGHQYRFGMPGPVLESGEWKQCLDQLGTLDPSPSYIVASGSLPPEVPTGFYAQVARIGREIDARVVVDTSGDPLRDSLSEGVYLLKPNLRELGQIAGEPLEDEPHIKRVAGELIERGRAEVVLVTLGSAGALLFRSGRFDRIPAPTVPIESRVGAGDSTMGGMVLALARGEDPLNAARYGVAAGAACVMTPGTNLCRLEDTQRLYDQVKE